VAMNAPARIHFGTNGWQDIKDIDTEDTGLGVHVARLPTETLKDGEAIQFTFYWPQTGTWEGQNYEVAVSGP
jgi:glucoamylase